MFAQYNRLLFFATCTVLLAVNSSNAQTQSVTVTTSITGVNPGEIIAKSTANPGVTGYAKESVYYQIGTIVIVGGVPTFVETANSGIKAPDADHKFTGLTSGVQYQIRAKATFKWPGPGAPPGGVPKIYANGTADRIAP